MTNKTGKKRAQTRKGRLPDVLKEAEVEALRDQCTQSATGLRNRALIELMLSAGLRVSEAVELMPGDIDWKRGEIRVNDGKGEKDRIVPVDSTTLAHLQAWSSKREALGINGHQPFLVGIRTLEGMTTRNAYAIINKQAELAGIEQSVNPHMLRHTYATRLLDDGYTIREVQQLLGHADVSTTMIYTHVNPAALRKKIQADDTDDGVQELARRLQELPEDQRAALAGLIDPSKG